VTLGLLLALLGLVPLAHATPPDTLWLAGIHDAADSDEMVFAATLLEGELGHGLGLFCQVTPYARVALVLGPAWPDSTLGILEARAPPTA
jgi:hypothetical protein